MKIYNLNTQEVFMSVTGSELTKQRSVLFYSLSHCLVCLFLQIAPNRWKIKLCNESQEITGHFACMGLFFLLLFLRGFQDFRYFLRIYSLGIFCYNLEAENQTQIVLCACN